MDVKFYVVRPVSTQLGHWAQQSFTDPFSAIELTLAHGTSSSNNACGPFACPPLNLPATPGSVVRGG